MRRRTARSGPGSAASRRGALLALLASLLAAAPLQAEVSASLEPRVVDEFDTVRLNLRDHGTSQAVNLDLEPLTADFEVLTSQSSGQYRSINGQVQAWVDYQILLRPRSAGELTVPPVRVRDEWSPSLTLRVRGVDAALREAIERMVFFETEITRDPVYVQAQTVLIRRLYYASGAQIYSDLPGLPEIPDAIVMPLGETTSTTTIRDGQRYGVIEQRFAILPEQSGTLTIPEISVTSSVRVEVAGRTRRSGVRVATEPLTVEVLPIPPEYPADQPWLPAEDVRIVDRWEPDANRIDVGDPARRVVAARVTGNVSSAIPPLDTDLPDGHFRRYPEPAQLDDDTSSGALRGTRQEVFAIIPTAPGQVTLPATALVWWDVAAQQVRRATAPGRTLTISGAAALLTDPAQADEGAAGTREPAAAAPAADSRSADPGSPAIGPWLYWLAAVAALLGAGWLLRRAGPLPPVPALQRLGRRRALRRACRDADPAALQAALHAQLRAHYRTGLAEALRAFRQDGHGDVLDALNARRYHDEPAPPDLGDRVLQALAELARARRRQPDEPLPALYD